MKDEASARIRRATLEVEVDGTTELVALALRDGSWIATSSDGRADGPHVAAAFEALGLSPNAEVAPVERGERSSRIPEARPEGPGAVVATLLSELVTAIVRGGVRAAKDAPAVMEAMDAIQDALPNPVPLGIARAMGRLRIALASEDVETTARLLDGITRLTAELCTDGCGASPRVAAWLGGSDGTVRDIGRAARTSLSDRHLLEVGRGKLAGFERRGIERRHLLCVKSGTLYREDFDTNLEGRTVGPSPRFLRVGLSEVFSGPAPKRIRLLQYEVVPRIDPNVLLRAGEYAHKDFESLIELYRNAKRAFPALAEPFVLIAAERYTQTTALDRAGHWLGLRGDGGEVERFRQLRARAGVRWLAGVLTDEDGVIVLAVHSACVERSGSLVVERLH